MNKKDVLLHARVQALEDQAEALRERLNAMDGLTETEPGQAAKVRAPRKRKEKS